MPPPSLKTEFLGPPSVNLDSKTELSSERNKAAEIGLHGHQFQLHAMAANAQPISSNIPITHDPLIQTLDG